MTSPSTITAAADLARGQARAAFIAALWQGKPLAELAALAAAAGHDPEAADRIRNEVAALQQLVPLAAESPKRRAAADKARKAFDALATKLQAEIDALESRIGQAAWESSQVEREAAAAESAQHQLLVAELTGRRPAGELAAGEARRVAAEVAREQAHSNYLRLQRSAEQSLAAADDMEERARRMDSRATEFVAGREVSRDDYLLEAAAARENAKQAKAALAGAAARARAAGVNIPEEPTP